MKNIIISLCTNRHTSQILKLSFNQNWPLRNSSQKPDLQPEIKFWENQFTCRNNNLQKCTQCLSKLHLSSSITSLNLRLQSYTNNLLMRQDLKFHQENLTYHLSLGTPNTLNLNSVSKLKMKSTRNLREERLTIISWRTDKPRWLRNTKLTKESKDRALLVATGIDSDD